MAALYAADDLSKSLPVKDFDPNQPRDPRTGEWIDTPGLPSIHLLSHAGTPVPAGMAEYDPGVHGPARTSLGEKPNEALELLAKAHRWPDEPVIPIRPMSISSDTRGEFVHRGVHPREIRVNEMLSQEEMTHTLIHEMGHFLDSSLADESDLFLSEGNPSPAMENFLRVARASKAMQTVEKYAPAAERNYLMSPSELWARAYAQWVTRRAANTAGNWTDADFGPIARALEAVLRERGLL